MFQFGFRNFSDVAVKNEGLFQGSHSSFLASNVGLNLGMCLDLINFFLQVSWCT